MELCYITPTAGLERYGTLSKRHLVLAQIDDLRYMEFYRERRQQGDFIILDNGAYERSMVNFEALGKAINYYNPDVVVIPDQPFHSFVQNWQLADKFINMLPNLTSLHPDLMAVPHSEKNNWLDFWNCLTYYLMEDSITWIGLSKLWKKTFKDFDPTDRARIARWAKRMKPSIRLHALGMLDGSLEDLNWLAKRSEGLVESLDTSVPIWRGWNGYAIGDAWTNQDVDFDAEFSDEHGEDLTINNNIDTLRKYL